MIKRINRNLGTKVFLLTFLLLLFCNFTVFLLISVFTPQTYSTYLADSLNEKVYDFLAKAEKTPIKNSAGLFKSLLQNPDIISVSLLDENGNDIPLPENTAVNEVESTDTSYSYDNIPNSSPITMTAVTADFPESYTQQSYDLVFFDRTGYTLLVYGNSEPVYQLQAAFRKLFPMMLFLLIFISLVFSFFYSRLVTRLQKDIEKEKQLEKARLEFFSAASHELKTPVTIIKGQLEGMLLNIGVYKDHKKYLARSLEVASTLEDMIQKLLISSHLDTPDYHITTEPIDLTKLTRSCLSLAEDLLVSRELTIHLDAENTRPVSGNQSLLEKAVGNLISNAIFYSPKGGDIFITVKNNGCNIFFRIENTGSHIPEEALTKIFDPFYRTEQSRSRQSGGSGLGLYLTQKILKLHKSSCIAQNTEDGVCFSFCLPYES